MVAAAQKKNVRKKEKPGLVLVETEHAAAETKSSEKSAPSFLEGVAQMATLAEEAIRKLRTETHRECFQFKDLSLSYLFPQKVDSIEYMTRLENVVTDYLRQTMPYGLGERDFRARSPLEENTSTYAHTADAWKSHVYTARKAEIDKMVDESFHRIIHSANHEIVDMVFRLGQSLKNPDSFHNRVGRLKLCSSEQLEGEKRSIKTVLYQTELPRPEFLDKLYELCFNTLVKNNGWEELDDKKLAEALSKEKVPLEIFAKYTGREIKLPAEPVIEVGGNRTQILAPRAAIGRCELIPTNSWFSALEELRRQGSSKTAEINGQTYIRPFTIAENLRARIEDFNTLRNPDGRKRTMKGRQRFFSTWLDSCSGIHYLARTTRFRIIPQSSQLIILTQAPTADYLSILYAQSSGREMDNTARGTKYNQDLTKAKVLEQPAWLAAVEEDRVLLGEAFDIMRAVKNASADWKGMGFYVYPNKPQDELRPLFVSDRGGDGDAGGGSLLSGGGRFLRR